MEDDWEVGKVGMIVVELSSHAHSKVWIPIKVSQFKSWGFTLIFLTKIKNLLMAMQRHYFVDMDICWNHDQIYHR